MDSAVKPIRVGSRKSELALIQTKYVVSRLQRLYPNNKFEIHTMTTIGDRVLNISLPKIGEKSLFTRDLEDALRNGGVDFVVHSLKDLPTSLPSGMTIGAVLEREDARDALVLRENYRGYTIETLPKGSVVGTSSLRRTAQIRKQYPNLIVCDIRGNLNTRLAKLDAENSKFAGIILAQAGLLRMGWQDRISQVLETSSLLYAVGQGALAVECRGNDNDILEMLQNLICTSTTYRIIAERSFLKTLGGGCSAPVAVYTTINGDIREYANCRDPPTLLLDGAVWSLDGSIEIRENKSCSLAGLKENNNIDAVIEQPQSKRLRLNNINNDVLETNPTIINEDADVFTKSYTINELVEKHIILAKKCPIVGIENENNKADGNVVDSNILTKACPLPIEIGQDVMGQCPFVGNEAKISMEKFSMTKNTFNSNSSIQDNVNFAPSVSSINKCPFALAENRKDFPSAKNFQERGSSAHGNCPFINKTVKMFDYSDDEKPQPQQLDNILLKNEDNLLCGIHQHACQNRELYIKCIQLGQQLAEDLIKKGALEVMKAAQAEIHSKV